MDAFVACAMALLLAVFYAPVIWGGKIFMFVDSSRFFYPLWKWGAGVLATGRLPFWNPDAQFGAPFFADPQMAYAYPPVPILYGWLSADNAFAWLILIHHFWALYGFWRFARREGMGAGASLFGCLAFGFSLHVVCSSWTPVALFTISWIPWTVQSALSLYREQRGSTLALSFCAAMELSAGYPVLVYLTALCLGGFLLAKTFTDSPQRHRDTEKDVILKADKKNDLPRRVVGRGTKETLRISVKNQNSFLKSILFSLCLCVSVVNDDKGVKQKWAWVKGAFIASALAFLYNLCWMLPFAEFFRFSNYLGGGNHLQALGFKDLATLLAPFYQGNPLEAGYQGPHYWISTYYLGLPVMVMLFMGIAQGVFPISALAGIVLMTVLSMGETLGVGGWLKGLIPGYSLVIRSGFWLGPLLFGVSWMASLAFDHQKKEDGPGARALVLWVFALLGIFGLSYLLRKPTVPAFFLISAFLMMASAPLSSLKPLVRQTAWVLALLFCLIPTAVSVNILMDRSYYDQAPALVSSMPEQGRIFFTPSFMKDAFRLQGTDYQDAYEKAKQRLYPNWPLAEGLEEIPFYNTFQLSSADPFTREAFQCSESHTKAVLDYLDIRYLLGTSRMKGLKALASAGTGEWVYENSGATGKWFSVKEAQTASRSIGDDFKKAALEKWSYGQTCAVEDPNLAGNYGVRPVRVISRYAQGVELEAPGMGRALLVSSEAAYPGWKAYVNGQKKNVVTVNRCFRGVVLEDGECQVVLAYEPATVRLGFFFALLVCMVWAGFLPSIRDFKITLNRR